MARPRKGAQATAAPSKPATGTTNGAASESAAKQAAEAAEARRKEREALEAKETAEVVKRFVNGDESLAVVAKSLNITSGKAAFLVMKYRVAQGEVAKITASDDDGLVKAINAARLKADEYSSWGWLAARSGKNEGWIKSKLAAAGLYTPRAENIASKRALAKQPATPTTTAGEGDKPKRQRRRGNAS